MATAAAAAAPRPPASKLLTGGALNAKIREYEQFANDVLKVDLQRTTLLRAKYQQEIEELEQLRRNIQQLQEAEQHELKSRVELGDGVFCRAAVPDTRRIFISVGLGFHAEFSLAESGRAIDLKQAAARAQVARCINKAARIKAHLKFVSGAIQELMGLTG